MNKKQSQSGSAHMVVIIVLVLALLGSLGFVFYQNFVQTKANDVTDTNVTSDTSDISKTALLLDKSITETVTGDNLTLDYPSNWIVASSTTLNPGQVTSNEKIFITSPDTNVKITFWAGIDGMGGWCEPESGGIFSSVNTYVLPNYSGYTLYETVTYGSGMSAEALVLKNNDKIKVDGSACEKNLGFFNAKNNSTNQLGIVFQNALSANTSESIDSARKNDNYKTAVKIVQSLHEQ